MLTTLDPVLVTGFDVEDMLVEEVSGLASGLRSVSCYIDWSAWKFLHLCGCVLGTNWYLRWIRTIWVYIDQPGAVRTNIRYELENVGLVPDEFVENVGIGHRIGFEELEHALVVCAIFAVALSVDYHVGIVDVGDVDVGVLYVVGGDPISDVLVALMAPEVLIELEDRWLCHSSSWVDLVVVLG